jgi:hypothetical protein
MAEELIFETLRRVAYQLCVISYLGGTFYSPHLLNGSLSNDDSGNIERMGNSE